MIPGQSRTVKLLKAHGFDSYVIFDWIDVLRESKKKKKYNYIYFD